jgi:hypothetical protein
MSRGACRIAMAILLVSSPAAPAFAQNHFHGGFHGGARFRGPVFRGPVFRGPTFGGGIFLGVPFAGFVAPYPAYPGYAYPGYAYPQQFAWYCPYPAGYFPYVAQCAVAWQPVPAG